MQTHRSDFSSDLDYRALTPVMTSEVACYRVTDAHHLDWIEPAGSAHTATLTRIINRFQRHLTVETAGPILMTT